MTDERSELFNFEARDEAYFELYSEIESQNFSRYEEQAKELLKQKSLTLKVDNYWIEYSLDRRGCSSYVHEDAENTISVRSWVRLSWGRKKKGRQLPYFFAKTETDVKFGLGN